MPNAHTQRTFRFTKVYDTLLFPKEPFHFDATFHKPSHFPNPLSWWQPGKFQQTLWVGQKVIGVKLTDESRPKKPLIRLVLFHKSDLQKEELRYAVNELEHRYDLGADLSEFLRLTKQDKRFAPIFKRWRGMRASTQYSLYELLIVGLVLQNTAVRRSVQMLNALIGNLGNRVEFGGITLPSLWSPTALEGVEEYELRDLKLGYRAKTLKRFSTQFANSEFDEQRLRALDDQKLRQELLRIHGVGPETVRILMSEAFHRHGTFHHVAPWQQKIYSRLFYKKPLVPSAVIIRDINRAYGVWASLAVHYVWEDVFWRRRHTHVPWLEKEIRL